MLLESYGQWPADHSCYQHLVTLQLNNNSPYAGETDQPIIQQFDTAHNIINN